MEITDVDPLTDYKKVVGDKLTKLTFKQINMAQLAQTLTRMKATGLMGEDDLSVRNLKQAQTEVQPLLLRLINAVIKTTTYPTALKTTKIAPIEKSGKTKTTCEGWRLINVVAALSKVIERVLLKQILDHLALNNLVGAQHHGSIKLKSTQNSKQNSMTY